MENISIIIREARPLYFSRKKRRQATVFASMMALCIIVAGLWQAADYRTPIYDLWSEDIYVTQNGSPIEDMGLPVDEYGLLMVG